MRFHTL